MSSFSSQRMAVLSDSLGESSRTFSRIWDCEVERAVDTGTKKTNSWSSAGFQPSSLLFRGAVAFVAGAKAVRDWEECPVQVGNNREGWRVCQLQTR